MDNAEKFDQIRDIVTWSYLTGSAEWPEAIAALEFLDDLEGRWDMFDE